MSTMLATTALIRDAIANNIRDNIGGMQVTSYVQAQVTPPSADVRRGPVDFDQSMQGGVHDLTMLVRVYVAGSTDKGSQVKLDSYLDPDGENSVKAAIESDRQLGGLVMDLHVTSATGEQAYQQEGSLMIGSEWTVKIWL
jgi:hypothetical protein